MNSKQNIENRNGMKEIKDSLDSSVALVKSILEEVVHLATEFRQGVTPELSIEFDECLSAIQTLMATMMTLQLISKKDEALGLAWKQAYSKWEQAEGIFKSSLNEMLRAYGHEDYFGLSDIMDEELRESMQLWLAFVEEVQANL